MEEVWKDIYFIDNSIVYDYRGLYQVSSFGNVKSLKRKAWNGYSFVEKQEKILAPRYNTKGYVKYALWKNGERKDFSGHKLVMMAFTENDENKPQINHKNGRKDCNRLDNLEYCNNSENQIHAIKNGLRKIRYGIDNPCSIKIEQYDLEGNYIKEWDCMREAISFYNNVHICDVCKGKRKKASGYIWRYKDAN